MSIKYCFETYKYPEKQDAFFISPMSKCLKFCFLALSTLVLVCSSKNTYAQQPTDSGLLPFAIADEKKLSDEDLANKKEGLYVTAVPEISSDPINGFGYGAEGSLFFNGKRSDPFFNYTPYRAELDIILFNTTRNQREIGLKLDIPYIFNTKWRLRVEAAYEINPNLLYFGATEKSLDPLTSYPKSDSSAVAVNNSKYNNYSKDLDYVRNGRTNHYYNGYTKQEAILNISAERSYMDSKLRLLAGFEVASLNITTFDNRSYKESIDPVSGNKMNASNGPTLLQNDFNTGRILGVGKGLIDFIQLGIVYDTRDLEPDPSKGIFAEVTNEFSTKALGSKYNFNKTFGQVKYYQKLFPSVFKKVIFASRFGMGYTAGASPFFEYQDQWSSEGSIEGLGGAHTIRGYKQSRFLGKVMNFANFELRGRFVDFHMLKQHIALSAVPFFDIGGVWDSFSNFGKLKNYRYSEGLGFRIAWNVNTILRFDYAVSKEDGQFFFNFGHSF